MNEELFEQVKIFLPKYLSAENQKKLFDELKQFPNIGNYYYSPSEADDLLQGDGWKGFAVVNFETQEKKEAAGIVISNSCDVDTKNPRYRGRNILFAPIVSLTQFRELLVSGGKNEGQIDNILQDIRNQLITDIFYLPEFDKNIGECIIILDDIHPQPLNNFLSNRKVRLFSLSQTFFYVFLLKLSIHFTRIKEDVNRFS